MGAGDLDYKEQSQKIDRYTGGLMVSHNLSTCPSDVSHGQQTIHLSSYCLKKNMANMFSLWADIFNRCPLTITTVAYQIKPMLMMKF